MSISVNLADAIIGTLRADTSVAALVGTRISDGTKKVPANLLDHISIGASDYSPDDYDCVSGRIETIQIDGWCNDAGKLWKARQLADAIKAALHDVDIPLTGAALISCRVVLVRVMLDRDGIWSHAVVQCEANIEE